MQDHRSGRDRRNDSEDTERLNRIEEKLDKVGEAIVSLARMEERMITLFKRMDNYDGQVSGLLERLAKIEISIADMSGSNKWLDRVVVVIITGAIGIAVFAGK